jgi:hypothetical protein
MAPKTNKRTRKVTNPSSLAKKRKVDTVPSEPSSSSALPQAVGNTDDADAHDGDSDPDNKSTLSAGIYTITNVGRKRRAALCSSDEKEGVVASLDGTNVIQEAGDEVSTQF